MWKKFQNVKSAMEEVSNSLEQWTLWQLEAVEALAKLAILMQLLNCKETLRNSRGNATTI